MDRHAVIIGSGLGGLSCAYILAKKGFKVTVLEKNSQIGGCLQTFVRKGAKFETGMHYIGSMGEGESLHSLFARLNLLKDVELSRLDSQAYDLVSICGDRYSIPNGEEQFVETFSQSFPSERRGLQNYWATVREVAQASPLRSFLDSGQFSALNGAHVSQSASAFIKQTVSSGRLQQILAANAPLYAGRRNVTSLYTHAIVRDFYNAGAYRIVGGSDAIARSLARSIQSMGGQIINNAKVLRINCDLRKATGVELSSGERVEGDCFVAAIHPCRTLEMLDTPLVRKAWRERIAGLQNSVSNFTVYLRFRPETVPYLNSNFFHFSGDAWDANSESDFLYMHLCEAQGQKYAASAVLIRNMNFDEVARWKGSAIGRRGADYEDFKARAAARLIDELEKQIPGVKAGIETFYASTPLTYLDYTGTEDGSTYGIVRDCNNVLQTSVSHRTKIPNLYLTGQNIHSHGILGVIAGAFITAGDMHGTDWVRN